MHTNDIKWLVEFWMFFFLETFPDFPKWWTEGMNTMAVMSCWCTRQAFGRRITLPSNISAISVISVIGWFPFLSTRPGTVFFVQDILHTSNPKLFPLRGGSLRQREQANRQRFKRFRCQIVINNSNVDSFEKSSYCIWIWISPIKLKLRCQATAGSSRPWSCLFQILIWTDRRHLHSFHFPFWTLHLWRFESFCILSSDICCMLWNLYAINSIGTRHVCPETNVVDKLLEGGVAQLPDGFVSLCLCTV